jgi:hypothetical protein
LLTATNGVHARPGAIGSENSVSGNSVSRSPTRVPPPGAENAVRPSCAPRPAIDQVKSSIMSATVEGGMIVS